MRNFFKILTNRCVICNVIHTNTYKKWCKSCQINYYRNFTNYKSENENEIIDNLIKKMQLKILNLKDDIIFEWVPYNQFSNIKVTAKGDFATVYSAIWKDSSLNYDGYIKNYVKSDPNQKVTLKCLHNSQNVTNEFLNEV